MVECYLDHFTWNSSGWHFLCLFGKRKHFQIILMRQFHDIAKVNEKYRLGVLWIFRKKCCKISNASNKSETEVATGPFWGLLTIAWRTTRCNPSSPKSTKNTSPGGGSSWIAGPISEHKSTSNGLYAKIKKSICHFVIFCLLLTVRHQQCIRLNLGCLFLAHNMR